MNALTTQITRTLSNALFSVLLLMTFSALTPMAAAEQIQAVASPQIVDVAAWWKEKCETVAGESISETIDGVVSVKWISENGRGHPTMNLRGGINTLGLISNAITNLEYLRFGLHSVEFDALEPAKPVYGGRIPEVGSAPNPDKYPVGRFSTHTWDTTYQTVSNATVHVIYRGLTTPEEESQGLFGRVISIRYADTGKELARRSEFFKSISGVAKPEYVCPPLGDYERSPRTFIAKVVNPNSYGCMPRYEQQASSAWRSYREASRACDHKPCRDPRHPDNPGAKYVREDHEAMLELQLCDADYYSNRCNGLSAREKERCEMRGRRSFVTCESSRTPKCPPKQLDQQPGSPK